MTNVERLPVPVEVAPITPFAMIERAIQSGAPIETLERLMALQERWEANGAKKAYDDAMQAAQAEMRPVATDASNPQTRSRYASYEALDSAIRPIYTAHGFSLSFDTADSPFPDHVRIVCEVACGGHRMRPHIDMPADGKGAKGGDVMTKTHAMGAAITYGRRYLLGMIFNITIGRDIDGNTRRDDLIDPKPIDKKQFDQIVALIIKAKTTEQKLSEWLKIPQLEKMDQTQFKMAEAALNKKIKQNAEAK